MKILITGGCGFIGTNAALYFTKKGHEVVVVDNLSRKGSEVNAKLLAREKGIKLIKDLDVERNYGPLKMLVCEDKPDVIIHAAAQVAVTSSVANPFYDFSVNARGTLNVLESARCARKQTIIIFTSTNKVYGEMENVKVEEKETRYQYKDKPFGIPEEQILDFHSPYGCSKGCADQYVRDYYRIYGLPTIVFRQSCIYGRHQFGIVDQGWVSYLTMSALFGKPITIFGDGKQVRDVLFMDDLSRAFESAVKNIERTRGQIYNIGGGCKNTISVSELVSLLKKRMNGDVNVALADWRPGDQKVYVSDIRKAKQDFGWEPAVKFKEGFEQMFSWIQRNKKILKKFI